MPVYSHRPEERELEVRMRQKPSARVGRVLTALLIASAGEAALFAAQDSNVLHDPSLYQALHYRFLGPYRGGRASTVAGIPD